MKELKILKWIMGAGILMLVSCNSWLDVKPDNKVLEEDLYSTREGFDMALNGIYLGLADKSLYGKELSCGYLEALAQRYNINQQMTGIANRYVPYTKYEYENKTVKIDLQSTWEKMYKLIANCNNILEQAVLHRSLFTAADDYNHFLGKLYALRAFMHFDVFRLWGPTYTEATKGNKTIPYYKYRTSLPMPLSTAEEVVGNVLGDLRVADSLMVDGAGSLKMEIDNNAVHALQARVFLYAGEKGKAYDKALELLDQAQKTYPFVTQSAVQNSLAPDRLYYTEQIFLLENSLRNQLDEELFDYMLDDQYYLAPQWEKIQELFPNTSDYRYLQWRANPGNGKSVAFQKFAKITDNVNPVRTRGQSLLKISEIYLILVECAPNQKEREEYLDQLRVGRGYQEGSVGAGEASDWEKVIREEYSREFYGEGQYFFFLKRKGVSSIPAGAGNETIVLGPAQYVLPLPDSESQYR